MNKQLADNLQKKLGISQEQIVREEYEMILLKWLFESEIGKSFVFKGGTALRLAYGSPRFSEDLDFSVVDEAPAGSRPRYLLPALRREQNPSEAEISSHSSLDSRSRFSAKGDKFNKKELDNLLKAVADQYAQLTLIETRQKKFTYFGLFRVREEFMNQAFSIKFEASVRPVDWKKDKNYKLLALNSKVTNLMVLAQAATLRQIREEKLTIKPPRIRDIFDLWFIGQKMGKPMPMDFGKWDKKVVKRELHKFLPEKNRRLLEQWLPED